jgi:hypothetical protein
VTRLLPAAALSNFPHFLATIFKTTAAKWNLSHSLPLHPGTSSSSSKRRHQHQLWRNNAQAFCTPLVTDAGRSSRLQG